MSLSEIQTKGKNLPARIVMHGVAGVGKSSFGADAQNPVFVMSRLETGIVSLKDAGLVPDHVGYFPECQSWQDCLDAIGELTTGKHDFKTVVLDVANGFERLCHEAVCQRDYKGNWQWFTAYQAGYDVAVAEWRNLLVALDNLREARGVRPILLCHTKVANFKNPEGPDYERYQPDMNPKTWAVTYGWADLVLFANYETFIKNEEKDGVKKKGVGGEDRYFYTNRTAAWDAKHRHGLSPQVSMGTNGKTAWTNLQAAIAAGKAKEGA